MMTMLVVALEAEKANPYAEKVSIHKRWISAPSMEIESDKINLPPSGWLASSKDGVICELSVVPVPD